MDEQILYTNIKFLKGVGDKRATMLAKELNIYSYKDLLYYFPFRYVDRSEFVKIKDISSDEVFIQVKGTVIDKEVISSGKNKRVIIRFADATGQIDLVFFAALKWIYDKISIGQRYVIFGKPSRFNDAFSFVHPEVELESIHMASLSVGDNSGLCKYIPVYITSEKMKNAFLNTKTIAKMTKNLINECHGHIKESLPEYIVEHYRLISLQDALENIHYPSSPDVLTKARLRLKFEELFFMQLEHQLQKSYRTNRSQGFVFSNIGENFNKFYKNNLKFELTGAQKRVIKEIRNNMRNGHQMNRLLQGDVGSGKTLVALMCMLISIDNGYQAVLIAPTEILAQQHYNYITNMLKGLDINIALLTGSIKGKVRTNILSNLSEGVINIIIGTHALLEKNVVFKNLGLAIIDEQHRFGVEQRSKVWGKNRVVSPHILVMTATPIPRTLAMTVYGDLDVSIIDELPPGRKPINTLHLTDAYILKLYDFMHKQIQEGRQIYVVYPLIHESEKLDLKDLMAGYDSIVREFPLPKYQVSIVHGQMKAEDKDYEMDRFKRGIANIMVATTVIEVGVDVPNATVMIVQNAERFGLSQLHQLRGRVGRGANQSYCILMTKDDLNKESKKRIDIMCSTNDGFVLAQEDLAIRGPGSIQGTQQSGVLLLKIADIVKDEPLVRTTRDLAIFIVEQDPRLDSKNNILLKDYFIKNPVISDYSKIS
ncbi:MAG: ATP-dependent DNA helicase RecG [Bacteroidales bacterium]